MSEWSDMLDRARKAEAAIAELLANRDELIHMVGLLKTEVERLKVCGNCKWFDAEEFQFYAHPETLEDNYHADDPYYISAPDKCDFTPTRWTNRE